MVEIEGKLVLCYSCGKPVEQVCFKLDPRIVWDLIQTTPTISYKDNQIATKVEGLVCKECLTKDQEEEAKKGEELLKTLTELKAK